YPVSKEQCEWFYRRSGSIMRSPFMLNSDWFEANHRLMLEPNLMAEAAKDFGVNDDRVRLAIAHAAMREGKKVGQWETAAIIAAKSANLDKSKLLARAKSKEVARRIEKSTEEFHALQVTQRPTFLIESGIGDRAMFSGLARIEPIAVALD